MTDRTDQAERYGAQVAGLVAGRRASRSGGRRQRTGTSALFAILLGFSIFSDLTAIETSSKLKISGSFLALVLAMVFLGGTPAALIGVLTILVGWLRWRDEPHDLLNNLAHLRDLPAGRRDRLPRRRSSARNHRLAIRSSTSWSSASSCWRWRSTSR